jgi:hypothetical protein
MHSTKDFFQKNPFFLFFKLLMILRGLDCANINEGFEENEIIHTEDGVVA